MTRALGRLRRIARMAGPERVERIDDFMRRRPRLGRALIEGDDPLRLAETLAVLVDELEIEPLDHTRRLVEGMSRFARASALSPDEVRDAHLGALCHDVGKIGVPDSILLSPLPLDSAGLDFIHMHSSLGYAILFGLPGLSGAAELVFHHHEYWDGTGYHRVAGRRIPRLARMFSILDSYDSILRDDRPYRVASDHERAMSELTHLAGTKYDPELMNVFASLAEVGWLDESGNAVKADLLT